MSKFLNIIEYDFERKTKFRCINSISCGHHVVNCGFHHVSCACNAIMHIFKFAELPSLPIYREISRKYSKINPISRSPGFDLQSPAKESFCLFLRVFFYLFCRRTLLPAVSHLRYTESAESSRAETIEVYSTAGSVTCWPSRSMQAAAATV